MKNYQKFSLDSVRLEYLCDYYADPRVEVLSPANLLPVADYRNHDVLRLFTRNLEKLQLWHGVTTSKLDAALLELYESLELEEELAEARDKLPPTRERRLNRIRNGTTKPPLQLIVYLALLFGCSPGALAFGSLGELLQSMGE